MTEEASNGFCGVCGNPTERKCSACKLVFYCSTEHQQQNWKQHKIICRPFEVGHSKGLGRYLKATRDIKPGDLIFTEQPLVFGPKPHKIESGSFPCVGCCRLLCDQTCERCPDCFWPVCRPDCEGLKISTCHGFECNVLKLRSFTVATSFFECYRFDVLIVLRALYLQKYNKKKWDTLMNLESHLEQRSKGTEIFETIEEKIQILEESYLKPLKLFEQETNQVLLEDTSSKTIHTIYGILDVNATELNDEIDATILYATASLLEHNCVPNTIQIIDNKNNYQISVRAALPIDKDEHITSMYTHILWGTSARREHLKHAKYFTCTCKRCQDPTELGTYFSALRCLGTETDPCGGIQLLVNPAGQTCTWICEKCKINLPDEDVMKFVNHLNEEVEKVMNKKPKIIDLEDIINKLSNFLHPNHYLMYTVKHSLVQLYGNEDDIQMSDTLLTEKLKMTEELIGITRKLDPGNARLNIYLAVLLNEKFTGKFKALIRRFKEDQKQEFLQDCQEISSVIEENKKILSYEKSSTAGLKLFEVVCRNEDNFHGWLKEISMLESIYK